MIQHGTSSLVVTATLFLMISVSTALAGTRATSTDYSLDYAITASAGGISSTGAYEVISRVITKGFAVKSASSSSYSIEPVGTGAANAAVADWSIY